MARKALIFYISHYSGHFHAAKAIERGILSSFQDVEVEKVNALDYTNPILGKIINKAYIEVIKRRPVLWGNIYDNPEVMQKTAKAREALHKFNLGKVKKLIESYAPDVVYCTQAFPCGMVAYYKKHSGSKITLVGVLTDHAPHSYWIFDEVDYYITPSGETALGLERKGVSPLKIKAYGIPVDPKFKTELNRDEIRGKLAFKEKDPIVLIMGGSQGLGAIEETVNVLLKDKERNYQLIVVTGANKGLFRRLKRLEKNNFKDNIRVFSYISNIDELMEVSDVIVTKAGGMTIAESLVKRLPMIIVSPIPGHERMNTDFLVKSGVALEAKETAHLYREIKEVLSSSTKLSAMKANAARLAKPESALDIARLVFK